MAIRDTARRKLTYEDYVLFPEDGQRPGPDDVLDLAVVAEDAAVEGSLAGGVAGAPPGGL